MTLRPRIAYLTPNALFHPNRGGRIRAHHLWRAMSAYADVTPIIIGDSEGPAVRTLMRIASARFLPRRRCGANMKKKHDGLGRHAAPGLWEVLNAPDLPAELFEELSSPDALVRHCLNSARIERILQTLARLRPDLAVLCDTTLGVLAPYIRSLGVTVVVGPHNLDSALYESMATRAPTRTAQTWNRLAANAFRAAEELFAPYVDQLWVCSEEDANRFSEKLVDRSKIRLIPNVYDVGIPSPIDKESRDLVFVGQANYYPNEDAIRNLFLISKALDDRGVEHRLRIVGRVSDSLKADASRFASIDMVGQVPSVAPFVEGAAVVPIALTMGGGTRLKILEALSLARPVLSTPIGIEGIDCENGVSAVVEPNLAAFPDQIEGLLRDRERAQRIAIAGWELAKRRYSHEALRGYVGRALADLGLTVGKPSGAVLGRNLGARIVSETASFNAMTRLLTWTTILRIAAPFEALSAELICEDVADLPNAFVQIRSAGNGIFRFKGSAILPAAIAPETLRMCLNAWDARVFRWAPPHEIAPQTLGLLTLEPIDGSDLELVGWTNSSTPDVVSQSEGFIAKDKERLPGIDFVRSRHSRAVQSVGLASDCGYEQTFSNVSLWVDSNKLTSQRLAQFKDKHAGESAWIVGNGPSVRIEDLDRLEGRLVFGFNRFHLAHETTKLRATYTFSADAQMIEDFGQRIVDESGGVVFIIHPTAPDLIGDYIWIRMADVFPPLFSKRPQYLVSPGGSTPFVAMQIAYYMGVRRFYFYGADFTFRFAGAKSGADIFRSATGDGNHFIANYRSGRPWCPPSFVDIGASFLNAKLVMEAEGGFIRNVTRGGALEIFPRQDFESALASE